MNRLAVDTSAAVDYMRPDRTAPPPLALAETIFLPLPVVGELFAGAYISTKRDENLRAIDEVTTKSTVLLPTTETARIYGQLRAREAASLSSGKLNDLWIAALCVQHDLPSSPTTTASITSRRCASFTGSVRRRVVLERADQLGRVADRQADRVEVADGVDPAP